MPRSANWRLSVKQASACHPELRASTPEVPCRRICGLRDVLIHNYMGVDIDTVWSIVESDIPVLKSAIE
jgi:uncharacterized protein with HEPN domain